MITVVHLIFSLDVGGAENLLVDLMNEQVRSARVHLIIINRRHCPVLLARISPTVRVHHLMRTEGSRLNPWPLLQLWRHLWRLRPSVLHCHDHDLMKLLLPWRRRTLLTVHDVGVPVDYLPLYGRVAAISEAVRDDLFRRGFPGAPVVHNGICFDDFARKASYPAPGRPFRLVQVSRLVHAKKGQDVALRALAELRRVPGYATAELHLVGDGPSRAYLQALADELGLMEQVVFHGTRDRSWVQQHLHTFDVLLQPSRFEGFGLTVVEALAAGLPAVASDLDGPAEILRGLPTSFLCSPDDHLALARALAQALALYAPSADLPARAAEARHQAGQRFSLTRMQTEYATLYHLA